MPNEDWRPDIIVGIDFGMTNTGVAYAERPSWAPQPIQSWPGKAINELANKVPTQLVYTDNPRRVKAWGFLSEQEEDDDELDIEELFKLYLDPKHQDEHIHSLSLQQARNLFQDYLRCLYNHVNQYFQESYPRWSSTKVEFVFSVPTSWNNPGMIAETLEIIRKAGFGEDDLYRQVHIGLTEAEAAAVCAAREQFQKDDVILVCDAGGGTTDVNVLKVTSAKAEETKLAQRTYVEGKAIGSTFIDEHFRQLITTRLYQIQDHLSDTPERCAIKTLRGKFERFKCYFGSGTGDVDELPLKIQGLKPGRSDFPDIGVEGSVIRLQRDELREAFDTQVNRVLHLIDKQLIRMQTKYPEEQISYIILSGGLGSSPYLRRQLRSRFEDDSTEARPNMTKLRIILSKKPQLSVVLGLLMDRAQKVCQSSPVFDELCCRVSYGMVYKAAYNPVTHLGEDTEFDHRDRKNYAVKQIDWFVKQDINVPVAGLSKPYKLKIKPYSSTRSFKTQIVMSDLPESQLPKSMKHSNGQVIPICSMDASLDKVDMKMKNRRWYNRGEQYRLAEFNVNVVIGHADLTFQIHDKSGQKLNLVDDPITVTWSPPQSNAHAENEEMTAEQRDDIRLWTLYVLHIEEPNFDRLYMFRVGELEMISSKKLQFA